MKVLIFLIILSITSPFNKAEVEEKNNIKIASFNYPPYAEENRKTLLEEIIKEALKKSHYNIEFKYYPAKRLLKLFRNGEEKIMLATDVGRLKNQKNYIKILKYRVVLYYYNKNLKKLEYKSNSDLKGARIGILFGSPFKKIYKKLGAIVEETKLEGNLRKLHNNRLDLISAMDLAGRLAIKEVFPDEINNFIELEKEFYIGYFSLYYKEKYRKFSIDLEEGIKKIKENGRYFEILEKYYIGEISKKYF